MSRQGSTGILRGTFAEEYNRNGNDYYTTDSVVCDAEGAYLARVRVTSIYHLTSRE